MNPAPRLFSQRWRSEWRFQYGIWKTVVNWMVALYIVLPAVAVAGYHYVLLWSVQPQWLDRVPIALLFSILALFAYCGTVRVFLAEADQLFLLQCRGLMRRLTGLSLAYSFGYNLLLTMLIGTLLAPLLFVHYRFSAAEAVLLLGFTLVMRMNLGLVKQMLTLRLAGWCQRLALIVLFVANQLAFVRLAGLLPEGMLPFGAWGVLLLLLLAVLVHLRLNLRGVFEQDVARERRVRLRYAALLLAVSGVQVQQPSPKRKRPLVFPHSNLLFRDRNQVNVLTELCLKMFLRNRGGQLFFYLQLLLLSAGLVWFPPFGSGLVIWLGLSFLFAFWARIFWDGVISSSYVSLFKWQPAAVSRAAGKSVMILMLPGYLLVSFSFGLANFSWLGALFGLLLGYLVARYVSRLAGFSSFFHPHRTRRHNS